ncbi:MAG: hypothetical protein ACYC6M_01855, partial [Terriglobales bacterium]
MFMWVKKCGIAILAAQLTVATLPAAPAARAKHHHRTVRAHRNSELDAVKREAAEAEARATATAQQLQEVQETLAKQSAVLAQLQAEMESQKQATTTAA